MKRNLLIVLTALALVATVQAQATSQGWVGIWHADVGGLPTSTLTLANDTGALGGTVVLDMVSDEGGTPHVTESEAHLLVNPAVAGDTLTFQVKMRRRDREGWTASFEVKRTSPDKATIHCVNCGAGAPVLQLVKDH